MTRREEDLELTKAACKIEEGLNPWEEEFVEDMSKWLDSHETLTERQRAKL
jgi:hypothetical protein